jgi:hypothetical protein
MATEIGSRPASADAWAKALDRAIAAGVDILIEPISGATFAESTRFPGVLYVVTRTSCSCLASGHNQVCLHRAALLAQLGELALPAPAACPDCCGCGVQSYGSYDLPCETCGGSGIRVDRRLTGLPAVEITAAAA